MARLSEGVFESSHSLESYWRLMFKRRWADMWKARFGRFGLWNDAGCLRLEGKETPRTKGTGRTKLSFEQQRFTCFADLLELMSTPINEFQNLKLGGMPETRSQTQQAQRRGGTTSAGRGRGRGRGGHAPQTPARSDGPARGHSGLLYSTQNLSPGSSQRATEGLISEFFVDRLQRHESSRGTYYAFQLKKPVSVRIHNPALGEDKVECTCEEYQRTRSVCVHIYVNGPHLSRVGCIFC